MSRSRTRGFTVSIPADPLKEWTKRDARRTFPQASGYNISNFGRNLYLYYYKSRRRAASREARAWHWNTHPIDMEWVASRRMFLQFKPLAKTRNMEKYLVIGNGVALGVLTRTSDEDGDTDFHFSSETYRREAQPA